MDNIAERIEATKAKLKQLAAQKRQVEARQRAEDSKRLRSQDTRRKILIGAAILAKVERGEWPKERLLALLENTLTRENDRALFGLDKTGQHDAFLYEEEKKGDSANENN